MNIWELGSVMIATRIIKVDNLCRKSHAKGRKISMMSDLISLLFSWNDSLLLSSVFADIHIFHIAAL